MIIMSQKSYNGQNSVYLIPTPIGNLDDITLRAIETLKLVDVIFSEDTRVTKLLLDHLNIKKKLIASHQYNEEKQKEKFLKLLEEGLNVGIVTDRGTPIISDPGYLLVLEAIKSNYNVIALPGPTALIPALITSGINPQPFTFYGFLNSKQTKKIKELETLKSIGTTLIFYESPHRLKETLEDINKIFGDVKISVSREISKKFEEIYRGTVTEVLKEIDEIKGEIVIIVEAVKKTTNYESLTIIEHVNLYLKEGFEIKEAIKKTSLDRNLSKRDVYNSYHKLGR